MKPEKDDSGLFSIESVLKLQKLIFAGSPLSEVLSNIAQLAKLKAEGLSCYCTIWLPDEDGKELHCAAAPSFPGFIAQAGTMTVGANGGSCGTAIYREGTGVRSRHPYGSRLGQLSRPHVALGNSFRLVASFIHE